ncbi:uncharacterized protein LOC116289785 [Actinia tenebrosa]|uniref:Uncharacterized protein LOC116289785 n=1 Tax=Actinia tenebrosa TaxID=6105 RepID=A0A6P8HJ08_ACTTE|nr:uncharacterized protein LOC116289785 [Actinia tenebrosa]
MAFRYEETGISEFGKKTLNSFTGRDLDMNFNLKEQILSKYGSVEILKEKAKLSEDWQTQVDLASIYKDGVPELNIEKDSDTAIHWYETAIKNGDWECRFMNLNTLATIHFRKETVPHQRRAFELFLQAARLDDTLAQLNLAESYRCGTEGVVQRDIEEAFKWYRRAAGEEPHNDEQEDSPFLRLTGLLTGMLRQMHVGSKFKALKMLYQNYLDGDCPEGEPQPVKALYYLKKAAELGDPEAQKDLGLAYLTGESGHPKDLDKAKRWLGKAAKNGEQEAKQSKIYKVPTGYF